MVTFSKELNTLAGQHPHPGNLSVLAISATATEPGLDCPVCHLASDLVPVYISLFVWDAWGCISDPLPHAPGYGHSRELCGDKAGGPPPRPQVPAAQPGLLPGLSPCCHASPFPDNTPVLGSALGKPS